MAGAEKDLIILIEQGVFEIDKNGFIYRNKSRRGNRLIRIEKRRAEHGTGSGYLQIRATVIPYGKRIYASAHRLEWIIY